MLYCFFSVFKVKVSVWSLETPAVNGINVAVEYVFTMDLEVLYEVLR